MSEGAERSRLPWILAALVLVVGGAKLEAARPLIARALSVAVPVVPVAIAVQRVEGGGQALERSARAVGWGAIVAAELCVAGSFLGVGWLGQLLPVARVALYAVTLAALAVHVLEARGLGKARYAGYVGLVAGFALFLSGNASADALGRVLGAFFVGLALGGGGGLLSGELLSRLFKRE